MNEPPARNTTIALLAGPDATASTLYGMYDILGSAGRDWSMLMHGTPGEPLLEPKVVSRDGKGFRTGNGAWIEPHAALAELPSPDAVCVPELFVAPEASLASYTAEIAWLQACYQRGALLAAACTGALLFAEAGLLNDQDATTHWAFCEAMARRFPSVRVHPHRSLVVSGEGQRLIMAGGGTTWLDLAVFLVARLVDADEAMKLARINLIDWHQDGQQPYAALTCSRRSSDACITHCQVWAAHHYDSPYPVAGMVAASGLSERSFKRRFKVATGMTPMEYVHTLRLEEAKQYLESGDEPVEEVSERLGYADPSFFRRLFKRQVGLTPSQYRRRFRGMRLGLQ